VIWLNKDAGNEGLILKANDKAVWTSGVSFET